MLNPSAENIARYIYDETSKQLQPTAERSGNRQRDGVGDGNDVGDVPAVDRDDRARRFSRSAMVITEIFKSIQGEGTRAGLPCIFVRLTGCNLRCTWCDTAYAFHGGTKYSLDEIVEKVRSLAGDGAGRVPLVEITGGEPLLQPETPALAEKLLAEGYTVMIETSGERFVGTLPR